LADPIYDIVHYIDSYSNKELLKRFISPYYEITKHKRPIFNKILDATRNIPAEIPKPRKRLQFLGTDGARNNIDDEIWLKILWSKLKIRKNYVVTDCRFMNEYEYLTAKAFKDIKLSVTPEIQHQRILGTLGAYDPEILQHPSELEQDKIMEQYPDGIIDNNASVEELYSDVEIWLKRNGRVTKKTLKKSKKKKLSPKKTS
jgi:hypothetical protein